MVIWNFSIDCVISCVDTREPPGVLSRINNNFALFLYALSIEDEINIEVPGRIIDSTSIIAMCSSAFNFEEKGDKNIKIKANKIIIGLKLFDLNFIRY